MLHQDNIKAEVDDCASLIVQHRRGLIQVDNEVLLLILLKKLERLSKDIAKLENKDISNG